MSDNRRLTTAVASLLILAVGTLLDHPAAAAGAERRVPVVVELFTSEGCSSCPPADQALAQLIDQQPPPGVEIIGLSEHVDYWNRLGWTDPYSDARFTARQRDYASALSGSGLYTPQAVVDGRIEMVGSSLARVRDAVARAGREPKIAIEIDPVAQTRDAVTLDVRVPTPATLGPGGSAEVVLAVTEDDLVSEVRRGENQGRRLAHSAVVRRMTVIGRVKGAAPFAARSVVSIGAGWKPDRLRVIVFAQDPRTRAILGAASASLR